MANTLNQPIVRIPRAGVMHDVKLSEFLTPQIQAAANPKQPDSVQICRVEPVDSYSHRLHICIYDRSRTTWYSNLYGAFKYIPPQEFDDFEELKAPQGKIYQPILIHSSSPLDDSIYLYSDGVVAPCYRGRGIAESFRRNVLGILLQCGFSFCGHIDSSVEGASPFILGGARFTEEFIDPAVIAPIFAAIKAPEERFRAISSAHCLEDGAEGKLIRPELRDASLGERVDLLVRVQSAKYLVKCMGESSRKPELVATVCEILDDMQQRGIPVSGDFLELDSDAPETKVILAGQSERLWQHTYQLANLYSIVELKEFAEWLG